MPGELLLEVRKIDAAYGDVRVLSELSLEVRDGEIVTLLGSNGAGKTTTLRCICGVLPPRAGEVFFRGKPLSETPAHLRSALGIALVPEGRELWPQLTVRENLELGAYHARARKNAAAGLDRVNKLFPRLLERRAQMAGSLSGGEQQMCAIGRALMSEPSLLLLDEPSLGLAPIVVDQMFEVIRELHKSGMTILLVEQNLLAALEIATRGYVIETGKVTLQGTAAELSANANIRAAYLGL
jgi:branched-chain amino acid transport system ATP-binding protein